MASNANDSEQADPSEENAAFGSLDINQDQGLPKTCTVVEKSDNVEVYVVGTAHFSKESQEDVALVMRKIQPHVVFLELCTHRLGILQYDEEKLLKEAKDISFQKVQTAMKNYGTVNGLMQILLVRMSAQITKQLGMAPGGEFRRAFQEAQRIPHCRVVYGDRPISITLKRAVGSLSFFQKIRFAWHLISSDVDLSPEDIEKCKDKDMLEQLLSEMSGTFPSLSRVFVDERDVYLAHSLKRCTKIDVGQSGRYTKPLKVVAVLGIGHVNGVVNNWDKDLAAEAKQVLQVPKPTLGQRVTGVAVKGALVGGSAYLTFLACRRVFRVVSRFI